MLPILLSLPILSLLLMFQSAVMSRIHLLHGSADLLLLALTAWALQERVKTAWHWSVLGGLLIGIVSALPFGVMLSGYLAITALAIFLRGRVWKAPVLAMFLATFLGTLLTHALTAGILIFQGVSIPLLDSFNLVVVPSMLLNLLLAAPMYVFMSDLANWLYPKEIEV
jgi:rod shape-determining protein MreD